MFFLNLHATHSRINFVSYLALCRILPTGLCCTLVLKIVVDDFNQDQHLDIIVVNSGTNNIGTFLDFGNAVCRTSGYDSRPFAVASGDVNGDNMADIVIANQGSSTEVLLVCSQRSLPFSTMNIILFTSYYLRYIEQHDNYNIGRDTCILDTS